MVETGSLQRDANGLTVRFVVTDTARTVPVSYTGMLPDLFQEGKGVVAQGKLGPDGVFVADQVLAKHDENYMPPEAAEALAKAKQGQMPSLQHQMEAAK
jgi:cytochrome c-type biogenesis protein CcmE